MRWASTAVGAAELEALMLPASRTGLTPARQLSPPGPPSPGPPGGPGSPSPMASSTGLPVSSSSSARSRSAPAPQWPNTTPGRAT
jgi:hypothetical protein